MDTLWLAEAAQVIGADGLTLTCVTNATVYTVFGVVVFAIAFVIMTKLTPFSIRKEIEEDQNTALGVIVAGVLIGLALIISAAISG